MLGANLLLTERNVCGVAKYICHFPKFKALRGEEQNSSERREKILNERNKSSSEIRAKNLDKKRA